MSKIYKCDNCEKTYKRQSQLDTHLNRKFPCVQKDKDIPIIQYAQKDINVQKDIDVENITLTIEEESIIIQDIEYEYMFLYNKIHNFRKLHKSSIRQGLPIWMQHMRDVNNDFRAYYELYYFKRFSWKPTIALCLIQLKTKHIEKRDNVWCKYNASFNITHFNRMMTIKHSQLMTDIRDYYA